MTTNMSHTREMAEQLAALLEAILDLETIVLDASVDLQALESMVRRAQSRSFHNAEEATIYFADVMAPRLTRIADKLSTEADHPLADLRKAQTQAQILLVELNQLAEKEDSDVSVP